MTLALSHNAKLSNAQIAWRAAQDIADGAYVNLGIGFPEMVASYQLPGREAIFHTENGILNFGEPPAPGEEDWDLINAGKKAVTLKPGASFFHHADSFAMVRGGHLDVAILGAYQVSQNGDLANWRVGKKGVPAVGGAMERGQDIWDVQQALRLPSEATVQGWFLGHDAIVQFFNRYYGWVHVPALVVFLLWMFLRHRDQYPTWRTSLALLTLACFVIQLMPTAPPRLFPELGIVDTGQLYGESVYGAIQDPGPAQLSAFPSVHVAWAVVIAWGAWSVSTSRWRWLGVGHALMTTLVVVATGNHWWLDGLAALAILIVIRAAVPPVRSLAAALPPLS